MTSVKDSPFSLKDYEDIANAYSYYLSSTDLNSIYPPLNTNNQILFMPFLPEFIEGQPFSISDQKDDSSNFTKYSISDDLDDLDDLDDQDEKEDVKAQELLEKQELFEAKKSDTKSIFGKIGQAVKSAATSGKAVSSGREGTKSSGNAETAIYIFNNGLREKPTEKINVKKQFLKLIQSSSTSTPNPSNLIIPPNLYNNKSAVGFFDTLHDFKLEFCDTETDKKKKENYGYSKFMFTYLLQGGYPDLVLNLLPQVGLQKIGLQKVGLPQVDLPQFELVDFQANYSYLKGYTRPISTDGLENYFAIGFRILILIYK
jgi:hypothetical protein